MNSYIEEKKGIHINLTTATILTFVLLSAMNFANVFYYCIYIAFVLMYIVKPAKFPMNAEAWSLLIFGAGMLIFDKNSTSQLTFMIKPFTYILCYLLGYNFLKLSKDRAHTERKSLTLIVLIAMGSFLHMMLNMYINLGNIDRQTIDFWTRIPASATLQAMLGCLMIALAGAVLFTKTKGIYKIMLIVAVIMIMTYNLTLAGRTLILLLPLMLVISLAHLLKNSKASKTYKTRMIAIAICVVFALSFIYANNIFSVRSRIQNTNIYERFFGEYSEQDIDEDARGRHKIEYVRNMTDYLWGGRNLQKIAGGYAHDLYLDTYDIAGIIPFLCVIIFIISTLKRMMLVLKDEEYSFLVRNVLLCVYVVMNIMFFIEPILEGAPWFFATYCIIAGGMCSTTGLSFAKENMKEGN